MLSVTLVVILVKMLFNWQVEKIWLIIAGVLLLKIADTIIQYHVHSATVDRTTNIVKLKLLSIMSGEKEIIYPLDEIESILSRKIGVRRLFSCSIILEINAPQRNTFRITKRYGFTSNDLEKIHELIQSAK